MKQMGKYFAVVFLTLFVWSVAAASPTAVFAAKADKAAKAPKAAATVNVAKMGDMSDFDPGNPVTPTGDTIKIAVVAAFSSPFWSYTSTLSALVRRGSIPHRQRAVASGIAVS